MTNPQLPPGYTIRYTHYRRWQGNHTGTIFEPDAAPTSELRYSATILPTGGRTECRIYHGTALISVGTARCSLKDNFCKRLGRDISLGRALVAALPTPRVTATAEPVHVTTLPPTPSWFIYKCPHGHYQIQKLTGLCQMCGYTLQPVRVYTEEEVQR